MNGLESLRSVLRFRRLEFSPTERRLRTAASVGDLRRIARRRLPRGVFDYVDGAADDEVSLDQNTAAFRSMGFRPRVLRDVGTVDPSTMLLGRHLPIPLVLAPTGFTRAVHPAGELAVARAAARAGLPYALSTLSTRSIEEVAAATSGEKWFQVYVWRDRGLLADMLERASKARFDAIMITVDTAVLGRRERDIRRGFTLPPRLGVDTLVDGVLHPAWTMSLLRHEPIVFANVVASQAAGRGGTGGRSGRDPVNLAEYINSQFDPSLSWDDIEWIRSKWSGPVLLKGVQTVEDARIAAEVGVQGVILSNHGGRQLDGAPAPIRLVAPVADAVGDRVEIICDGGVRRGSDIVKAVASGARACMIGRAYLYGLAVGGERGVDHVLGLFDRGVRDTMALVGCRDVEQLNRTIIDC
jgi:L-lactate dehydrogenase (cytochrome)